MTLLRSASLLALASLALSAHAIVFGDDFSADQSVVYNTKANAFGDVSAKFVGNVTREIATYNYENDAPGSARSSAAIGNGVFASSSDAGVRSVGYCVYSFDSSQDFTGSPDVNVEILSNDLPGFLLIKAEDSLGGETNTRVSLPAVSSSTFLTVTNVFAGLDVTKIRTFYLLVGETKGENVRVGGFQAVPEPTTMAALGLGAFAMLRRRKRA